MAANDLRQSFYPSGASMAKKRGLWAKLKAIGGGKRDVPKLAFTAESESSAYQSEQSRRFSQAFDAYQPASPAATSSLRLPSPRTTQHERPFHTMAGSSPANADIALTRSFASSRSVISFGPEFGGANVGVGRKSLLEIRHFAESLYQPEGQASCTELPVGQDSGRLVWPQGDRSVEGRRAVTLSGSTFASPFAGMERRSSALSALTLHSQQYTSPPDQDDQRLSPLLPYLRTSTRSVFDTAPSSPCAPDFGKEQSLACSYSLRSRTESAVSGWTDIYGSSGSEGSKSTSELPLAKFRNPVHSAMSPVMALAPSLSGQSCHADYSVSLGEGIFGTMVMMDEHGQGYLAAVDESAEAEGELSKFVEERFKFIMGMTE